MNGRSGFWSYVHEDDADEGGRISKLAELLSKRVRFLTGQAFPIFLDRTAIGWGADWESKIDEALIKTTFFIPILTPSYFLSANCRNELLRFLSTATALGLKELILPIYYTTIPEFDANPPSGDDLIDKVRQYQWVDWRATSLEDADSSAHRKKVDHLAQQLLTSATTADAKPAPTTPAPGQISRLLAKQEVAAPASQDDEPGIIDLMAEGEEALPRLTELLTRYAVLMEKLTTATNEANERIRRSDEQRKGFAGRLFVGKWLANELTNTAEQLETLGPNFLEELLKVDPMVVAIFQQMGPAATTDEDKNAIRGFATNVLKMADAAEMSLGHIESLATTVHENSNWSKDLRKPMQRIERALRQFADARAVFRQWKAQSDGFLDTP